MAFTVMVKATFLLKQVYWNFEQTHPAQMEYANSELQKTVQKELDLLKQFHTVEK